MTEDVLSISQIAYDQDREVIRALFGEYLGWANTMVEQHYGIRFDINTLIENDMATLEKFMPPHGRLLVARRNDAVAGCIGLQSISDRIGEIKRLYVRPVYRRYGVGTALIGAAIASARQMKFSVLRLDSARFMSNAHSRYRAFGFETIAPYAESEIPTPYQKWWVFMELVFDS